MNKRIDWLDAGKGLGMLLVMLGHTNISEPLKAYIYTFHMPLFFFLSGYLFKLNKFANIRTFLLKKTKTLVIPYLSFSLIAYLWFVLLYKFGEVNYSDNLLKPLIGSLIAIRKSVWTVHSGALWFINCLICTELLFYCLATLVRKKKILVGILILVSVMGCLYNKMIGKPLPWSIDVTMISTGFYGVGFFYREYQQNLDGFIHLKTFLICLIINLASGYLNFVHSGERVDLYESNIGNIFLFYLSAFAGIGAFIVLVKQLKKMKSLQYIGKNSIIYLALHQKIVYFLFNLVIQNSILHSEQLMSIPFVKGVLYTITASVVLIPAVFSINHYLPFMIGKTLNPQKIWEKDKIVHEIPN